MEIEHEFLLVLCPAMGAINKHSFNAIISGAFVGPRRKSKQAPAVTALPVSEPPVDNVNDKKNKEYQHQHVTHPSVVTSLAKVTDTTHAAPQEPPSRVNLAIHPLQQ